MRSLFENFSGARARFIRDTQGAIALLFGLLALPLLTAVFYALDYSRATSLKSTVQSAADAAAITASMRLGDDNDEVRAAFAKAFRANLPERFAKQPFTVTIAKDKKSLEVDMTARIETTLIRIAGVEEIAFKVRSHARRPAVNLVRVPGAKDGPASEAAAKQKIMAEIQAGLAAARRGGLPVPANVDRRQLEAAAEMILEQIKAQH